MVEKIMPVRGTKDLYGADLHVIKAIEKIWLQVVTKYGFNEIRTPIIENIKLFSESVGELSDIVNKEMYVFEDKGGDKLVLRPENTAPLVRALVSNGLAQHLPLKYYYNGPMFRYERPQKGRYRQFNQLGVEYLGTNSYISDIEVILLAVDLLKNLHINNYTLLINSIGSNESLINYQQILANYYASHANSLSADSLVRLAKNPLRILDSKNDGDIEINKNAPKIVDHLSQDDLEYYNNVKNNLTNLNIKFTEDSSLVRGLDYYTHTVFEFVSGDIGAQSAIIAGGRYNNLISNLGGPNVGAVGFAAGVERLALLTNVNSTISKEIAIVTLDEANNKYGLKIAGMVRELGFCCSFVLGTNVANKLKRAGGSNYFAAIIIGNTEEERNILELKDLESFTQQTVSLLDLKSVLLFKYANYIV